MNIWQMNQLASKEVQAAQISLSPIENQTSKKTCVTETLISDFHKLTAVGLKSQILKTFPKIKSSRKYKTFNENMIQ